MKQEEWFSLLEVALQSALPYSEGASDAGSHGDDAESYYTVRAALPNLADDSHRRAIHDALSLSLSRVGILQPQLPSTVYRAIVELARQDGIILVPDTNALFNGTLHWLLRILPKSKVWILPFVVSLTQIQERDVGLKSLVNQKNRKNLVPALRSRAFINASLGLLERYRSQYQVVELDPALLRYLRTAGRNTFDQDRGDVLEDRLLIEGIHSVFRTMRTRTEQRVVTSDVLLARVLQAEGIPTLFLPSPKLDDRPIPCLNYSPISKSFCGAPLSALLWDLAHSFSSIRLTSNTVAQFQLSAYWPGKGADDWMLERLWRRGPQAPIVAEAVGVPETQKEPPREEKPRERPRGAAAKVPPGVLSDAVLPQASLPQVLRLAGAVRRGPGSVDQILARLPQNERPIESTARRGLEILRRAGVIEFDGAVIKRGGAFENLDASIRAGRLDDVSAIFERFQPYATVIGALREQQRLRRDQVEPIIRTLLGGAPREASARLLRFAVLLGQAWTYEGQVTDGSRRPNAADALSGLYRAFKRTARDGVARILDLLPVFCRDLHVSPWAASSIISELAAEGQLRELSFQPAAGRKPIAPDQVISGSLEHPELKPVPIDRVTVGGRPVFTLSGDLP